MKKRDTQRCWKKNKNLVSRYIGIMNNRVRFAVLMYLLIVLGTYLSQPSIMFTEDRKMKPFGIAEGETILSFPVFLFWIAVGAYYLPCMLCILFTCQKTLVEQTV